ncbi:hypothetical protein JKF63_02972 [Porcisia hertigi]|uniref:Uncharacterized protein n=1 Tax=Porcisia hertigi TaxID=2761500 RepID=A0A836IMJ5_9TRYP|nr:hypothetical protein JKF63_02972 [Porcisia hertigi]
MAVSRHCVRVSLFQCTPLSDTSVHQVHSEGQAGQGSAPKRPLFRSRSGDYRGDVLIPLASLPLSPLQPAGGKTLVATLHQLRKGLESRLSTYCILHVPADSTASFVEKHRLTPSSVTLSPPAAESSAPRFAGLLSCTDETLDRGGCAAAPLCRSDTLPFHCCARCSPSFATEATVVTRQVSTLPGAPLTQSRAASAGTADAPLICIDQLQRMSARRSDTNAQMPSPSLLQSPLAPSTSSPIMPSAEEWMHWQHDSANVFLTPSEAESINAVDAEDDSLGGEVKGGSCYAAFFSLKMLPPAERAKHISQSGVMPSEAVAATAGLQAPSVFTVHAQHQYFRLGLPPPTSLNDEGASKTPLVSPSLGEVVIDRLRSQRGLNIERLVDSKSGAAVLPCENAATLMAAGVVKLEAECVAPRIEQSQPEEELTQRLAAPSPSEAQSHLSSASAMGRISDAREDVGSNLLDHLLSLRSHHPAAHNYYDGVEASGWAERHTLISLSEMPSESELRLTSTESRDSSQTLLYASTPPSVASLGHAFPASLLAAEGGGSHPVPFLQEDRVKVVLRGPEGDAGFTGSLEGTGAALVKKNAIVPQGQHNSGHERLSEQPSGSAAFFSLADMEEKTASLPPVQGLPEPTRDSLSDMNDVFLYEDEETVMNANIADTEGAREGSCGSHQHRERRSSLVWRTPSTRGSGAATMLNDMGFSATPLIYRTSTQVSLSPHTPPRTVFGGPATTTAKERPTQRVIFATSSHSIASLSGSPNSGVLAEDEGTTALCRGDVEDMTLTGGLKDGVASVQVPMEKRNSSGDLTAELDEALGEGSNRDGTDQAMGDTEGRLRMSGAGILATPLSRAFSALSTTDSGICSARHSSSSSSSSCAGGDSPAAPSCEATPFVCREGADEVREGKVHATPPPLLGTAFSALLPSPAVSLPSPHPHMPTSTAALGIFEEQPTTSTAPCSTPPPSRRCTSEHELRSHLHSLVPLATQNTSERPSQRSPLTADEWLVDQRPGNGVEREAARATRNGGHSSERKRSRAEGVTILDASDSRPTAVTRVEAAQSKVLLSSSTSADSSDDVNTTNSTTPTPSTTVATRPTRMGSPIFFSPEELDRMVVDVETSDTSQTRSSFMRQPLQHTAEFYFGDICEVSEHASSCDGYGGYIASYPLHGSQGWGDFERSDGWGYDSSHSHTSRSHRVRRPHPPCDIVYHPERESSQQQSASSLLVVTTTADATEGMASAHNPGDTDHSTVSLTSSSGIGEWIRCSDEDSGGTGGDADCPMLVTQQELPIYTRHSGSCTESDVDGTANSDDDSESDTRVHT